MSIGNHPEMDVKSGHVNHPEMDGKTERVNYSVE
jgi:hypothetical protein